MIGVVILLCVVAAVAYSALRNRVDALENQLRQQSIQQNQLVLEMEQLRQQLAKRPAAAAAAAPPDVTPALVVPPGPVAAPRSDVLPVAEPAIVTPPVAAAQPEPVVTPPVPPVERIKTPAPTFAELVAEEPERVAVAPPPIVKQPPAQVAPLAPTLWERASALALENWTGILGAVILVTGVGFLGIYAALRVTPFARFWLISGGAAALLGVRWALRQQAFAVQLREWLQSSAAAIFLFACVGAASIPGLQWASEPLAYGLLLTGISVNLWLAYNAGREAVASLHVVLSLVALAVLPPSLLTLGAAASVTAFSVFVTYRQLWRWQLVLSIVSFFAFHLYWHQQRPVLGSFDNTVALALVLLVGAAGGVVQYRRIYAERGFEPVLFTAHLLNWTCLGLNLYFHSTGSVWKTIPLMLGAIGTFWVGRRARQLGLEWLFRTDTIISLILALAAALSLLDWRATPAVVLLFMLLETLLVAHVMARENEKLVFRVALTGGVLAAGGLLVNTMLQGPNATPGVLYRLAGILALAGAAGVAFCRLTAARRPGPARGEQPGSGEVLLPTFAGQSVVLLMGASILLAVALLSRLAPPVAGLVLALLASGGLAFGLASWVGRTFVLLPWLRSALLTAAQFGVGLAIMGLHAAGLSHAACWLLLYLENLLFQQWLRSRRELLADWHLGSLLLIGVLLLPVVLFNHNLPEGQRAALLLGAAVATVLNQAISWPTTEERNLPNPVLLSDWPTYGFGWLSGAYLLVAAGLLAEHTSWIGWVALAVGTAFLLVQRRWQLPGVAVGLLAALIGFTLVQWHEVASASVAERLRLVCIYLLPVSILSSTGLLTSFVPRLQRFVRQPWLYLLGIQLAGMVWLATTRPVLIVVGWAVLAAVCFCAAQLIRRAIASRAGQSLPEALRQQGQPDRYLLHLSYALLFLATLLHFALVLPTEGLLLSLPARYFSAAALLLLTGSLAMVPPPTTEPRYSSWRYLHPWLMEATLALATVTVVHEVRTVWQPVVAIAAALLLEAVGRQLPPRQARLRAYGRLLYGLAALGAAGMCLLRLAPGRIFSADWWAVAVVALSLFVYAALALRFGEDADNEQPTTSMQWPSGLTGLETLLMPPYQSLVAALLYPAFVVLGLLLIQSFDKSLLTGLLMVEVFAVFSASLLLRRADFRYTALAGMAACLVRLVFFDLRQSHTLARAAVFIFMGLLLLGMNALYARFRNRATPADAPGPNPEPSFSESSAEPPTE
jgi:hypothetical protein